MGAASGSAKMALERVRHFAKVNYGNRIRCRSRAQF